MDLHAGKFIINAATIQLDRWLEALGPGYAEVDGRSFDELLEFPIRFGRLINFYDLADKRDGDWVAFFARDPTMILAAILAVNLAHIEAAFLALERQTIEAKNERKFELLCELFTAVMTLAREINSWLQALGQNPQSRTARLLRQQIVAAIDRDLAAELRRLVGYAEGAALPEGLGRRVPLDLAGFLPIWDLHCDCPDDSIYRGRSRNRKIDHACPYLAAVFIAFVDALSNLQAFARSNLDSSLDAADHQPHIALYIAFARLFRTAQNTINTISDRYIHFYYHDILREDFRAAVPDHVYLAFTLAADQGVTSTTIPRGTLFSAGQDSNGIDILYAADKSLLVTAATIAKLRTLRVVHGPLFAGAQPGEVARRIFSSEIATAAKPSAADGASSWNTFGETQIGKTAAEVTALARLGFAVASPYLLLTGGNRLVTLRLSFSNASAEKLAPLLARIHAATNLTPEAIMRDVLAGAFSLSVSTADGWLAIERYDVLLPPFSGGEPSFALQFTLPAAAAAVVAYDPSGQTAGSRPAAAAPGAAGTNGANPDPKLPTLKAYLRQQPVALGTKSERVEVEVYPLSLLGVLELTGWAIDTSVSQFTQLQLANTDGPIDSSNPGKPPFLLLGAPPALGSFLEIRQPELFAKTLASLTITITWFNLPQNQDGFKGWYRDYVIGMDGKHQDDLFDNKTFRVGICVVNPIRWNLADKTDPSKPATCAESRYPLFYTKNPKPGPGLPECVQPEPAGTLCSWTEFNLGPVVPKSPPDYYNLADSAVRLQLTAPPYAFGDDLYAQNVLSAVIKDLPDPKGGPARCQEWKVLFDAAQRIGACIDKCASASNDYQPCIEPCLEECMLQLVQTAVACLLDCLVESKDTLGEARILEKRSALLALQDATLPARARSIKQLIDQLRTATDPVPPPPLLNCLVRCAMLLDAVLCIATCEEQAKIVQDPENYKQSITSCLRTCMAQLQKPYEDCCKDIKYPNPPWLPQAASVSLDYTARCSVSEATGEACGRFYYLLPFDGYSEPSWGATGIALLPAFPCSGNLYIGFTGLEPPQPLTLLFQMTAASAAGWSERPPTVTWSYLDRSGWTALKRSEILSDGTNGLQNSGILALNLPSFEPDGSRVLDPDCQWLMAGVVEGASLFPNTSRIFPHAVLATWQDNGSVAHLAAPLAPNTITSSVENLPAIATIAQPMESFGGRPPETGRSFQTWLGERLRHKDRGILAWDYERLVLEQFPTVWKVQALPARSRQGAAPGNVLVVVVPGPDSIEVMDPTEPLASADLLGRIGASLETGISPFVTLQVANPIYVRIMVTAEVLFADDDDSGAFIRRLDDELVRYLSPWPYDAARAAKSGDYASEDEISEFIQTRLYVDAILSLAFTYDPEPGPLDWYFLTSAKQHHIIAADAAAAQQHQLRGTDSTTAGHNA